MNTQAKSTTQTVLVALLLVYVVWGTTYFVLAVGLQHMPALSMNASRFVLAGVLMLAWTRLQKLAWPTAVEWRNASLVGVLMVGAAMNLVTLAQSMGIGSGLMATVITTMPMWLALWTQAGGERVPRAAWLGLALGVAGAATLALERDFSTTPMGALCAFGGPFCWSLGSYVSRKFPQPSGAMASGAQWLVGGVLSTGLAFAFEQPGAMLKAPAIAWFAWSYLLLFGTMAALSAYLWLLQNTSAALAGSYAFVNPAIALGVGVALGAEHVTGWVWLALPLIFAALYLILLGWPRIKRP